MTDWHASKQLQPTRDRQYLYDMINIILYDHNIVQSIYQHFTFSSTSISTLFILRIQLNYIDAFFIFQYDVTYCQIKLQIQKVKKKCFLNRYSMGGRYCIFFLS